MAQTSSGVEYSLAIRIAIWIHIGTLGAVLIAFKEEWKRIFFMWNEPVPERKFLIVTTVGTGLVGIPVKMFLIDVIGDSNVFVGVIYIQIGLALLITGILLKLGQLRSGNERKLDDLSVLQQLLIGFSQGFTIIPGISRSGTTVSALLFTKVEGEEAFKGSFLMSVPAVFGGALLEILDVVQEGGSLTEEVNFLLLFVAIAVAFLSGLLTIQALLKVARKLNFALIALFFGVLLLVLGIILLL